MLEMDADISIHVRSGTGPPGPPATPSRDISISGSLRKAWSRDKNFKFCPGSPGQIACPGIGNALGTPPACEPAMSVTGLDEGDVGGCGLCEVAQGTLTARTTTGTSTAAPLCCKEGRLKICFSAETLKPTHDDNEHADYQAIMIMCCVSDARLKHRQAVLSDLLHSHLPLRLARQMKSTAPALPPRSPPLAM